MTKFSEKDILNMWNSKQPLSNIKARTGMDIHKIVDIIYKTLTIKGE